MAIGLMGNPLKKGKGDVISTCLLNTTVTYPSMAGRLVVTLDSAPNEQMTVSVVGGGNHAGNAPQGILCADVFKSRIAGEALAVAAITEKGKAVPVRVTAAAITDLTKGVGYTATGEFCQADHADSVGQLAAKFVSTTKDKALDENGAEFDCAIIELSSAALPQVVINKPNQP